MQTPFDTGSYMGTQFMSEGQMEYFPHRGYLTTPDFGSFRQQPQALPGMSPNNIGFMGALAAGYQGRGPFSIFDHYVTGVNTHQFSLKARRKVADSVEAISTTLLDSAIKATVGVAVGFGTGSPLLGAAAAHFMPNVFSSVITDRTRQMRAIQEKTMRKIISGPDLDVEMGQGFSDRAARSLDREIRTLSSQDTLLKQKDYRRILDLGMEGGMFDYSQTSQQYKQVLARLVKNHKAMMELLETEDPKAIMDTMSRLQRMGARLPNMTGIVAQERMYSKMLGISHADMINTYGQQGAMIYNARGLSPIAGSLENIGNVARMTVAQRMGILEPGMLALSGGVGGLAQTATQATAALSTDTAMRAMALAAMGPDGKLDSTRYKKIVDAVINGDLSIQDLIREVPGNIQRLTGGDPGKQAIIMSQTSVVVSQLQEEVERAKRDKKGVGFSTLDAMALDRGRLVHPGLGESLQYKSGLISLGYSGADVANLGELFDNRLAIQAEERKQYQIKRKEQLAAAEAQRKQAEAITSQISKAYRSWATDLAEGIYGPDPLGKAFKDKITLSPGPSGLQLPDDVSGLGVDILSQYAESSQQPGEYTTRSVGAINKRDSGGKSMSYGTHQLNSEGGWNSTVGKFVRGSIWDSRFKGTTPGTAGFNSVWKTIAEESPQELGKAISDFSIKHHYPPLEKFVKERFGIDPNQRSVALRNVLYSIASVHGSNGSRVVERAWGSEKNLASLSDKKLIELLYGERLRKDPASDRLVYYTKFSNSDQKNIEKNVLREFTAANELYEKQFNDSFSLLNPIPEVVQKQFPFESFVIESRYTPRSKSNLNGAIDGVSKQHIFDQVHLGLSSKNLLLASDVKEALAETFKSNFDGKFTLADVAKNPQLREVIQAALYHTEGINDIADFTEETVRGNLDNRNLVERIKKDSELTRFKIDSKTGESRPVSKDDALIEVLKEVSNAVVDLKGYIKTVEDYHKTRMAADTNNFLQGM